MESFRETRWVPHVTRRVTMSLQLCADTNLTNMQRQLSLEVVVTLSETAAAMLRKHTAIVAQSGEPLFPTHAPQRPSSNGSDSAKVCVRLQCPRCWP